MTCNVGTIDRTLRIVFGLGLLSLVFVGPQTRGASQYRPADYGSAQFRPAYSIVGMSTCSSDNRA